MGECEQIRKRVAYLSSRNAPEIKEEKKQMNRPVVDTKKSTVEPVASQAKGGQASDFGLPAFHAESSEERQVKAMETRQHTPFRAFIKQHAGLTFYILVFALSWGYTHRRGL